LLNIFRNNNFQHYWFDIVMQSVHINSVGSLWS